MKPSVAYWGSFAIHGVVFGVAVLFVAETLTPKPEPMPPTEIISDPGDDSGGGDVGGGGAKAPGAPMIFKTPERIDATRVLRDWRSAREREAAEATRPVMRGPDASAPKPKRPAVSSNVVKPSSSSVSGGFPAIPGASVQVGAGPGGGSGKPVAGGVPGKGEGEAGGVTRDSVEAAFAAVFRPLFREEGRDLQLGRDHGVVRLHVADSGLVSLAGWTNRPDSREFAAIVEKAVLLMRPVASPPEGAREVAISVTGIVE